MFYICTLNTDPGRGDRPHHCLKIFPLCMYYVGMNNEYIMIYNKRQYTFVFECIQQV